MMSLELVIKLAILFHCRSLHLVVHCGSRIISAVWFGLLRVAAVKLVPVEPVITGNEEGLMVFVEDVDEGVDIPEVEVEAAVPSALDLILDLFFKGSCLGLDEGNLLSQDNETVALSPLFIHPKFHLAALLNKVQAIQLKLKLNKQE